VNWCCLSAVICYIAFEIKKASHPGKVKLACSFDLFNQNAVKFHRPLRFELLADLVLICK
jgi:hypothetical protein